MKIAILGARGIPARYGGFDTLVEELSVRLVNQYGIDVTVCCRSNYYQDRQECYSNVKCTYISCWRIKGLESLLHTFLSALHAITKRFDIIFIVDPANAPIGIFLKLSGQKVVIHTDGLGWKRRKWGKLSRRYYKWVEALSAKYIKTIVTDNPVMREYYIQNYNRDSVCIAYGAENSSGFDDTVLQELGIKRKFYLLVVARLEQENNTDLIVREYVSAKIDMPLVVVGDAPYDKKYMETLQSIANEKVLFAGRIDDQAKLNTLYAEAYLYIHGHEVGGTNPSLLRAMGLKTAPLVIDVPFNTSVIEDCGFVFDSTDGNLSRILKKLAGASEIVEQKGHLAKDRADTHFTWESVVAQYKDYFDEISR
ncbi:MAG: DUF1972 domain-containing protein [Proteobacteria bacterium]|nr:DUF1972 domain-containing protein [Pseudomonadota bacterium]